MTLSQKIAKFVLSVTGIGFILLGIVLMDYDAIPSLLSFITGLTILNWQHGAA